MNPDLGCIELKGCTENNLKNVDVKIPLGGMVCVTGVSGGGEIDADQSDPAAGVEAEIVRLEGEGWGAQSTERVEQGRQGDRDRSEPDRSNAAV